MNKGLPIFNYSAVQNTTDTDVFDVFIDGDIVDEPTREILAAWWDDKCSVSYKSLRDKINSSNCKTINITINSGGGSVTEAMAMHDMIVDLEQNKGVTVNCKGMGIVASAATYILMASKNSTISENSWFMIHNCAGYFGYMDVNELESCAATMRRFNDAITNLYVNQTGKPKEVISKWMNAETWFIGSDACKNGFVAKCDAKATFTNSIKPKNWLYGNMVVLNSYNSSAINKQPKNKGMKKQDILNAFTEALAACGLTNKSKMGDMTSEQFTNAFSTALDKIPAADNQLSNEQIQEAVDKVMTPEVVQNTVKAQLEAMLGAENNVISAAITNATKDFVTVAKLENLKTDLAEKLGTPGNRKIKDEEGKEEKVTATNHPGISWTD